MAEHEWVRAFPGAATVCDRAGVILEMNERSVTSFAENGGAALIGANALDCHPEPSRTKLAALLESGERNVYTIEKRGVKKLIYQAPWYVKGEFRGLVELSLVIPFEMPHFVRAPKAP